MGPFSAFHAIPTTAKDAERRSTPMKETTIAQISIVPAIILGAAVVAIFGGVASTVSLVRGILLVGFGLYFAWKLFARVARMRVAVTDDKVIVVNLDQRVEFDLHSVSIDAQRTRGRWWFNRYIVHGLLSKLDRNHQPPARILVLTDASGKKTHVGVAPPFGSRLDTVAEDLISAIEERRIAA